VTHGDAEVTGLSASVEAGLARVTVTTPERRIDVALPEDVPLAELLPDILRLSGDGVADNGERHGGWALRRVTGALLDPSRNLGAQGVRDGDVLHLVPRRTDWPEVEYDDVVEAVAGGARRYGRSWGGTATRRCALAVSAGTLTLALLNVLRAKPPWVVPGLAALGLAIVLTVVGMVLSRAMGDAVAGAALAASGLPYAFAGGALIVAPDSVSLGRLGAPELLSGSATLILFGLVGYVGIAASTRIFAAAVTAGSLGLLGGLLGLSSLPTAGVAAVTLTAAIGLMPGYPLLAIRIGKLPLPRLPQRAEDMLRHEPAPLPADVFAAVARSDEILTGALIGVSAVSLTCVALLVRSGGAWPVALAVVAALALLLRARLFPTPRQRISLLVGGIGGLVLAMTALTFSLSSDAALILVLVATALAGAVILGAGLLYSQRPPSPYMGWYADIFDVLLIVALVPLTSLVVGFNHYVQDLFSSIG
jgi:type VII secretion integral membrane protein EccD